MERLETTTPETGAEAEGELSARLVEEVLFAFAKAARARQLYDVGNPAYRRFITDLRTRLAELWKVVAGLPITVTESGFRWQDETVLNATDRQSLPSLFYKDGIRALTFLEGIEDEVELLLGVIQTARLRDPDADDLLTLLWEQDFAYLRYTYVDVLAEGLEPADPGVNEPVRVSREALAEELGLSAPGEAGEDEEAADQAGPAAVARGTLDETLYFLDAAELERLRGELAREGDRDLKDAVLNALFDRLEDPLPERQAEILGILRQLLASFLARGDLASAAQVLRELRSLLEAPASSLDPARRADAEAVFQDLSDPAILTQLLQALEEGGTVVEPSSLRLFFAYLRPEALETLIRASVATESTELAKRLRDASRELAEKHGDHLLQLLQSPDPAVQAGAAKLAGAVRLAQAAGPLARLLQAKAAAVRLAAVEALVALRSRLALEALQRALDDADRDVRIAAAQGLGQVGYRGARERFEEVLKRRSMRDADLTEKIAFFEAYGSLGIPETVPLLDRLLNGRGPFRRRQPSEIRACAARALARVATPAARSVLERALADPDPVVRSAVARGLRGDEAET